MTAQDLADLHQHAFHLGRGWSASEFASLLTSPYIFLISRQHSFALGRAVAGEAELLTIATLPEHQRKGLGGKCLIAYEVKAKSLGANRSFLEVAADNAGAIQLYQTAGYQECGRRKGYYRRDDGSRLDAVMMARDIV